MLLDFLANNYFWFLIITIILILSLIGYLVDTSEKRRMGTGAIDTKETEQNFETLAKAALQNPNQSLGEAVAKQGNPFMMNVNGQASNSQENVLGTNFSTIQQSNFSQQNVNGNFQNQNNSSIEVLDK